LSAFFVSLRFIRVDKANKFNGSGVIFLYIGLKYMLMKRLYFLLISAISFVPGFSQVFPDKDYPVLFNAIQLGNYFPDSKTFPDCIPLMPAIRMDSCYLAEKNLPGFKLDDFIRTYFMLPVENSTPLINDTSTNIEEHIGFLWDALTCKPSKAEGSLIHLPFPYIKPGGRFREIYYWDSYFTMLGLKESGKTELIENMIDNFAYLIDTFGFVPNGNRTYYLSRSQPPFFSLMIDLLNDIKGEKVYTKYLPELEKEYNFWMSGKDFLTKDDNTIRRVVFLPDGEILNRYWDDNCTPRPEAFKEDIELAKLSPEPDSVDFRNIRAACESGWDFSSRWLNDGFDLETIETTKILPVDLNCLLYHLEATIANAYKLSGNKEMSGRYRKLADLRKKAIQKYFWRKNEGFFVDYHFVLEWQNMPNQIAGIYPLFFSIATKKQAKQCAVFIETHFLKQGGLLTTTKTTHQQWDAPNGWAPLQYICIQSLENYRLNALADTIKNRWLTLNLKIYTNTGKLLEKYNVEDLSLTGGGGEYPTQDGFGWTNGVYLNLMISASEK
jgi:alpha,alpha-trehalase